MEYLETNGPNPGSPFGAAAVDYTGKLYAISDGDGTVYKYTVDGNTARGVRFTSTNSSTQNDGTMCPYAEILVDYGDAPLMQAAEEG